MEKKKILKPEQEPILTPIDDEFRETLKELYKLQIEQIEYEADMILEATSAVRKNEKK